AGDITQGNRCAAVLGLTLRLVPGPRHTTFKGLRDAKEEVRNQPFLDRIFVKAADVAFQITKSYAPPEINAPGKSAIESIEGQKGVVYLKHCWRTPREKLTFSSSRSGDHIDLWDGTVIEIYRDHGREANGLVKGAEKVLFWKCRS